MQSLRCLLVTDERPGHQKQSQGVINALQRYVNVIVQEEVVTNRNFLAGFLELFRFLFSPKSSSQDEQTFDLIIGTGSRTHMLVLTRKRETNGKAVICMSPASYLRNYFDLCFIPAHDRKPPTRNSFQTLGPPNTALSGNDQDPELGLILVGGVDHKSHFWDSATIIGSIRELIGRASMGSWTISSSPRTPLETENDLRSLVSESEKITFLPFAQTGPCWVDQQYLRHKTAWITGDSMSMIYEALSAGCQVGILPVKWKKTDNKFVYSQANLVNQGRVVTLKGWLGGTEDWREQGPLDEANRCAREILRRWWPKNLQ